jgi:hypothetical protein
MTIRCDHLDNLLFEGDPASLALAEEHARTCATCRELLASWNDIGATAKAMPATWTNDLLWPRIERALKRESRRRWAAILQIAAALLVMTGLGAAAWQLHRRSEFDKHILAVAAVEEVDRTEKAHQAAIDNLEKLAGPPLENSTSPLIVSYKEKLLLLDDAIAECQSQIDHNRQNAQLRKQLLAIYGEKQRTLQDVLREETHANP